ncbi:MAG: hypothetical protein AAFQ44_07825 [Pseudomonadota bacterium]
MVRTYKQQNAYVRGSRLSAEQAMGICFNYLSHVQLDVIAKGHQTTVPTVARLITRFQKRLQADTELLAILCGLLVEADDSLSGHADLIRWLANASSKEIEALRGCVYGCPGAHEMSSYAARAFMFSGKIDVETDVHPLDAPPDTTFHFRDAFCDGCGSVKLCTDPHLINTLSIEELLGEKLRSRFKEHLPAILVRSCAKWRVTRAAKEGRIYEYENLDGFADYYDLRHYIMQMWFRSALPYLESQPL